MKIELRTEKKPNGDIYHSTWVDGKEIIDSITCNNEMEANAYFDEIVKNKGVQPRKLEVVKTLLIN